VFFLFRSPHSESKSNPDSKTKYLLESFALALQIANQEGIETSSFAGSYDGDNRALSTQVVRAINQVGGYEELVSFMERNPDIKDAWGSPIKIAFGSGESNSISCQLTSFGPNGIDEQGHGDDMVHTATIRTERGRTDR